MMSVWLVQCWYLHTILDSIALFCILTVFFYINWEQEPIIIIMASQLQQLTERCETERLMVFITQVAKQHNKALSDNFEEVVSAHAVFFTIELIIRNEILSKIGTCSPE